MPSAPASSVPLISFQTLSAPLAGHVVAFVFDDLELPPVLGGRPDLSDMVRRAADIDAFKAKAQATLDVLMPPSCGFEKLSLVGLGPRDGAVQLDWTTMGGVAGGRLRKGREATVVAATAGADMSAQAAADVALGLMLRGYSFDRYKTKKKPDDEQQGGTRIAIAVAHTASVKRAFAARKAIAEGVVLARDLVNEPPNVLNPEAFAARASELEAVGCAVERFGEKKLKKLGMNALLAVGQGSYNESQMVVMRWTGAKDKDAKPVVFIGKGVTFDTGGISIKPAGGMEDMKGDMAGAACVVGLMHALAARKAKVNAIGLIGLVENMPDGKAQRPGDIVTSLSGQTIEIINTDAEGRLVLADVLWYAQDTFKPRWMINLATLTGAIMVALGQEHAGLFSNDDTLAERITAAGKASGEKVWRMPLASEYDKIMDSKVADVKNSGGRHAGAITAAQFLQRFVNGCAWAHLDIAGTAMGSPATALNQGWSSGWGVRLLDRLVADHYED